MPNKQGRNAHFQLYSRALELPKQGQGSSRRGLLTTLAAAALVGAPGRISAAAQSFKSVTFDVPLLSCDCHQHVIGDPARYPMQQARAYTPPTASLADLQVLHHALHIERVVLVQPSFYGTDNSCLLDSLRQLGKAARGIVVVDDRISETSLDDMHALGVRGVRVNQTGGTRDPAALKPIIEGVAARVARRGWHVQTFLPLSTIAALRDTFAGLAVPVVFDHFGGATSEGTGQPGFDSLVALLKGGSCYVKLARPYQQSSQPPAYADMAPLARAFAETRADRVIWGSDWPHTNSDVSSGRTREEINPNYSIDDVELFNQLPQWIPDGSARRLILSETPARLFQF